MYTIQFTQGVGSLQFGMSVSEVSALLAGGCKEECVEDALGRKALMCKYDAAEFTLIFEGIPQRLSYIDISVENASLYGIPAVGLSQDGLMTLMRQQGWADPVVENEAWGECRLGYADANADFYFEQGSMVSISLGQ